MSRSWKPGLLKYCHAALLLALLGATAARAGEVLIGSGAESGLGHVAGQALCSLVNRAGGNLTCTPLPTAGSLFNLANVNGGALEFGLARSDWHYHAVNGSGPFRFADAQYGELRSLFSLYAESLTLVVRRGSQISRLADLPGRRVNIGSPGSDHRAVVDNVLKAMSWSKGDFLLASELGLAEQSLSFCHDRVDAMIYATVHPDDAVTRVTQLCDGILVPVRHPRLDQMRSGQPYFSAMALPADLYLANADPVETIGMRMTVVASAAVDEEAAYAFVSTVFANLGRLRRMHPAFAQLETTTMANEGLFAPLHQGAMKYYREAALR